MARCINPPDFSPPFWKSAQLKDWDAVKRWKQLGANLTRCDQNGNTLMILAAFECLNDIKLFRYLKNSGIDPDHLSQQSNCSAAHAAAFMGCVPVLNALKEVGANLNILGGISKENPQGFRPIYPAIIGGHLDAVRFLITHEAYLPTLFDSELFRTTFVPQQSMRANKSKRIHDALETKIRESYQSQSILLFPHEQALFGGHQGIEALLLRSSSYQKLIAISQIGFWGSTKPGVNQDEAELVSLPALQ